MAFSRQHFVSQSRLLKHVLILCSLQAFDDASLSCMPLCSLEEWGQQFETCVDSALRSQYSKRSTGLQHLPKAFRGRCPAKFVKSPFHIPIKKGWAGHFETNCEVLSFKASQQVTQTRRLQSLWHRLTKWKASVFSHEIQSQLVMEWKSNLSSNQA